MSTRERKYTNIEAAERIPPAQLLQALTGVFVEVYKRPPTAAEQATLSETVTEIKSGPVYTWSMAEAGLRDETWDLDRGPHGLLSQ